MKNFYETQRIVWISHDPHFFPARNAHRFDVFDGDGTRLGVCIAERSNRGMGWFFEREDGRSGPYPNRAAALRALVGEDPEETRRERELDTMSQKIIFEREVVLIQPHPLQGVRFSLNENRPGNQLSPWTSVACAIVQTSPQGDQHAVVTTDDPGALFQPVKEADRLGLLPQARTALTPEAFAIFVSAYTSSMNNLDNVRALAMLIEEHAPDMRFMPEHLVPVLRDGDRFLGRMFLRYDLSKYQAVARFGPEENQQPKKAQLDALGVHEGDCDHLISGWYAFHNIERAVEVKIRAPADWAMTIHAVSREYL